MDILPGRTFAPTLYTLGNTMADRAAGVLGRAAAGPLIVVGNSAGGSCALEMARLAPDRIEALVLVGTKADHRPEPELRESFIASLEADRLTALRRWVDGLVGPNADHEVLERVLALAEPQSLADLLVGVRVFHSRPAAGGVMSGWTKPLVVVRGEHDQTRVGFSGLEQTIAEQREPADPSYPNQRPEVVADCGHYVNLERPEAFNAILAQVVASCIAGAWV